ncbi:MAG: hypothetical protein IMZ53_00485 [Thermoplasmata archaeon]|nr:hypothetical protein [Thermoplasmata archaeon]
MEDLTKKQLSQLKKIMNWKERVEKWAIKAGNAVTLNKTLPEPPKPPILP